MLVDAADLAAGDAVETRLARGSFRATVTDVTSAEEADA